ncbi:MAG: PTS sugar transporter subunit IIA [Myxococcales bacterium FL481]|nr:MAG: PTS sugar transporter subunit IIA [Myxococcales bacterium FL481]
MTTRGGQLRRVGVVMVGHGRCASALLSAARPIVGDALDDVTCVDAGEGQTPDLAPRLCEALTQADSGAGVVIVVDLLGASPCNCALKEGFGHQFAVVSGMNLAMMLKLAALRGQGCRPAEIAAACADAGQRSIVIRDGKQDHEQKAD